MKNFRKLSYLIVAGLLVVACENKENKTEGTEQTTEVTADTSVYKLNTAASSVKWTGKKVTGQHNGSINTQSGELNVAGNNVVGGTITMDMTSITNEDLTDAEMNGKLIGHLKSDDFFSVENNPTSTFVITSVKDGADGKKNVTGNLTIKNITQEISFPAEIKVEGDTLKATGTAVLDRTKWEVKYGSGKFFEGLGDKMIYDDMELAFDISAVK